MLIYLNTTFLAILEFSKANPIIASAAGLWGLSAITFFLRDIPSKIWGFIVRQTTTTLDLNSQDAIFHDFLTWLSTHKLHRFVRTVNISNRGYSTDYGRASKGLSGINIGYGRTYFFHNKRFFSVYRGKEAASNTDNTKEVLSLTVLGRTHTVFKSLFDAVKTDSKEDLADFTRIYRYNDVWESATTNFKRDPSTVILNKEVGDKLYSSIDSFLSSQQWYRKNGIPYKLGILLTGPPGTGKTSLIKAVCAKYNRNLYTLNIGSMTDDKLIDAISTAGPASVIAIEDIDAFGIKVSREDANEYNKAVSITMSGLLNGIDGASTPENIILIATTNHIEKLDPALIRDGRFDIKLHIDNLNEAAVTQYLSNKYEDFKLPEGFKFNKLLPAATIQRLVFENRTDYTEVLKHFKEIP